MTRQATRRHMGTIAGALALATGLLGAHAASAATPTQAPRHTTAQYTFKTVASPHDPTFTQLLGIDDHQAIAGYDGSGQTVDGTLHPNKGFTLTLPSTFTPENYPASAQTQVIGINNHGDTAGFYIDPAGATHGFLEHNGSFSTTDLPGTPFNQLLGLNNRGQESGYFQDADGLNHAYVRDAHGVFTVLPLPNSQATGINDQGVVVGFTQPTTTTSSAFVWQHERATLLSYPGSTFTQALGENDQGQIVGTYNDADGNGHGFVYGHGRFQTIDAPGASGTVVNGINNRGQIVGFFTDAAGNTVGFVGTPGAGHGGTGGTGGMPASIDIGLVLPLSGQDAALGLSAEHGAQLAIDQANAAHLIPGTTFALVPKDDAGTSGLPDAATGATGVKALIADARVAGIIGAFDTPTALAELPLANQAPIALISPSAGNPCLTSADPALGCGGAFVQQYQAAYGTLGRYSASGYDSANVLLAAIKAALAAGAHAPTSATATSAATTFRQAVIAAVAHTNMTGVTGTLSFTAAGDLTQGTISIEQLASVNGSAGWKQVATQPVP